MSELFEGQESMMITGIISLAVIVISAIVLIKTGIMQKLDDFFNPYAWIEKKEKKAKEQGHVLEAVLLDCKRERDDGRWEYDCKYEYIVNGEKRIYRKEFDKMPPEKIDLYYKDTPDKIIDDNMGHELLARVFGIFRLVVRLSPIIIAGIVVKFLGLV